MNMSYENSTKVIINLEKLIKGIYKSCRNYRGYRYDRDYRDYRIYRIPAENNRTPIRRLPRYFPTVSEIASLSRGLGGR